MTTFGWDKFRVLVTNGCNYRCPFCHNEGQEKGGKASYMSTKDFYKLVDLLKQHPISEFVISGGEPFLHPDIIDMLVYACDNLNCDVSCATNLSRISGSDIQRLSNTRIKFNIQFPYIDDIKFKKSTGNGCLSTILDNIRKVKEAGLEIGLNTVIQSSDENRVEEMVKFAATNHLPLKLLPQIGGCNSQEYKTWVFPIIRKYAISEKDKGTGAIRWEIEIGDNKTSILYIDSPCFSRDISTCKRFAELRIHPGLVMQSCIEKSLSEQLDFFKGDEYVINQLAREWNNFKKC